MRESTPLLPGLSPVSGKAVEARFDGGSLSSGAAVPALREIDARLRVAERFRQVKWRDAKEGVGV